MSRVKKPVSSGEILKIFFKTIFMLWRSEPVGVSLLAGTIGVQAGLPAVTLLLTKWTVDEITQIGVRNDTFPLLPLIAAWLAVQLIQPLLDVYREILQGNIAEKFTAYVNLKLLSKSGEILGLKVLEDKSFHDDLNLLQQGAENRPMNLVVLSALTIRDILVIVSLMVVLATLAWWVPLALIVATLPATIATVRLRDKGFQALLNNSEDGRLMSYLSRVGLGFEFAKEVRLFNALPWLKSRYETTFLRTHLRMRDVRRKELTQVLPTYTVSVGVTAGLFSWAVWRASLGRLTAGQVVLIVQALAQTLFAMRDVVNYLGLLRDRILYFKKFFEFLEITPAIQLPEKPITLPRSDSYSVQFENVTFSYPDGRLALNDVSFLIPAGETVALVGENGSGKTTIVKLLLRFYDPDRGRILVDGVDLRELDLEHWRRSVSAVFQDFKLYNFSLRENIALGDLEHVADKSIVEEAVIKAGLSDVLPLLEGGLDSQLGKEFGGTELSGGQSQKVAIARALTRRAEVLILDEPTASIDPRSEHAIFKRFSTMAERPTTILITHRLRSVRMADHVIVLRAGKLVEEGTHEVLVSSAGEYSELWSFQVDNYPGLSHK